MAVKLKVNKDVCIGCGACVGALPDAFTFDADLFASVGLTARIAFVGNIVTGMACGAGSNVVYDILKAISGGVKKTENEYFMQKDLTGIDPGYEDPYTDTDEGMM